MDYYDEMLYMLIDASFLHAFTSIPTIIASIRYPAVRKWCEDKRVQVMIDTWKFRHDDPIHWVQIHRDALEAWSHIVPIQMETIRAYLIEYIEEKHKRVVEMENTYQSDLVEPCVDLCTSEDKFGNNLLASIGLLLYLDTHFEGFSDPSLVELIKTCSYTNVQPCVINDLLMHKCREGVSAHDLFSIMARKEGQTKIHRPIFTKYYSFIINSKKYLLQNGYTFV